MTTLSPWFQRSWRLAAVSLVVVAGCEDSSAPDVPDAAELTCPTETVMCDGTCRSVTTDVANCGACGHACEATETCRDGACTSVCADGEAICGGACTTIASDAANCGGCGLACAGMQTCAAGRCVAPACAAGSRVDDDGATCVTCTSAAALSPVGYWRLDETDLAMPAADSGTAATPADGAYLGAAPDVALGTATEAADGGTALTLVNDTTASGVLVDQYANMPTDAITFALWVKIAPTMTSDELTLFSYADAATDNAFTLFRPASSDPLVNVVRLYVGGAEVNMRNLVPLDRGAWTFVVVTWDAATKAAEVYVDGQRVVAATISTAAAIHAGGRLYLGQEQDGKATAAPALSATQALRGDLDDVAIYDRVLAAAEIRDLYLGYRCR